MVLSTVASDTPWQDKSCCVFATRRKCRCVTYPKGDDFGKMVRPAVSGKNNFSGKRNLRRADPITLA